jgi:hypothetical protein
MITGARAGLRQGLGHRTIIIIVIIIMIILVSGFWFLASGIWHL